MFKNSTRWGWYLGLGMMVASGYAGWVKCALAQITPDGTLPNNSTVNINGNIFDISGGTRAGSNLFHSFNEFSVLNGQQAHFNNAVDIQNIISRVTGSSVSNIDGLIKVLQGNANLFLLNPNGIVFGPNARLDIRGSFVGSTANSIKFADGFEFNAKNAQSTPLLTITVPLGLQFGANPQRIQVRGSGHNFTYSNDATVRTDSPGLQVLPGKTLALVGGDLELEGGNLRAESGRVELGSVASPSLVNLTQTDSGFALAYAGVQNFGDIKLSQKASVDTSGEGGGSIQVQGRRLSLRDGSSILSITSGSKPGGSFTVNATESVELIGQSTDGKYASNLSSEVQGAGSSGEMRITTAKLIATDGAFAQNFNFSSGEAGNFTVQASESIDLVGSGLYDSGLYTGTDGTGKSGNLTITTEKLSVRDGATVYTLTTGEGNAGNLIINTPVLQVRDGASVTTSTSGAGKAGNLTVNASEKVEVIGTSPDGEVSSGLFAQQNREGATGNAGDLTINTPVLQVKNEAIVSASTFGAGAGGDLTINTGTLQIENGSEVRASTFGAGKGGNLSVIADSVKLSNSYLRAQVRQNATGNAGDLTIKTGTLQLENGAQVSASTFGAGNGGKLTVDASKKVEVIGTSADGEVSSGLFTQANSSTTGAAGNLTINTPVLLVRDGASVSASTFGTNKGGNLTVTAESVQVSNGYLRTQASRNTIGNAGDLTIKTGTLVVQDGGQVSASTSGKGNGGALTVDASKKVEVIGTSADGEVSSGLFTQANSSATGAAGNLTINTPVLLVRDGASVSASTFGAGNGGNLTVNATEKVEVTGTIPNGQSGSRLATNVYGEQSTGNAGNLTINTLALVVKDSQVSASTAGKGNAGNLTINASEIDLSGVIFGVNDEFPAGLFAQVNSQGSGRGGKLNIETGRLSISNGAKVQVATFGQGDAGDLFIRASEIDIFETTQPRYAYYPTGIFAGVRTTRSATQPPQGNGGSATIETNRLTVRNGGVVTTTTQGVGNAGSLRIRATESIEVFGTAPGAQFRDLEEPLNSEISAAATLRSTGNGGLLSIETGKLIVRDGGTVSVRNEGKDSTKQAGNLEINARSINLDNQGRITATTNSGNGGDIFLTVKDLLVLRNQSTISATAGTAQQGGDGGNINIQAPNGFVVAVPNENSDITANAFSGSGGKITINTTGRFGLVLRSGTDIARLLGTTEPTQLNPGKLQTNDITAFSQQNPDVSPLVRTVETYFNLELVELPTVVVDTSNLIDTSCAAFAGSKNSEFTVTGRGGLPPSPNEPLSTDVVWSDTRLPVTTAQEHREQTPTAKPPSKPEAVAIVPATGWVFNGKGQVTLISHASSAANSGSTTASCPQP